MAIMALHPCLRELNIRQGMKNKRGVHRKERQAIRNRRNEHFSERTQQVSTLRIELAPDFAQQHKSNCHNVNFCHANRRVPLQEHVHANLLTFLRTCFGRSKHN